MSLFVKQNSSGGIIINSANENIAKVGDIVIDGFINSACLRVQSHYHTDHTVGFFESKLYHDILMSKATKDILGSDKNSQDIFLRPGIIGFDYNNIYEINQYKVNLLNNGHILGSSQVQITFSDYSIGYSGDFYDTKSILKVDHLIIDGSIGGLYKIRSFTRDDSINDLRELIIKLTFNKHVLIKAHSGLLEKVFFWISDLLPNIPRIADERFINSLEIYSNYGYGYVSNIIDKNDKEHGLKILKSGEPYIRLVMSSEDVFDIEDQLVINCSRFQDIQNEPIIQRSEKCYIISLSDHADILGTLEYVKNVNPEFISVDQVRMRNPDKAIRLLNYIANELNIIPVKLDILPDERF